MRVFVAGATGAVGSRLLPLLVAAGHSVVGLTRSPAKAEAIAAPAAKRRSAMRSIEPPAWRRSPAPSRT